MAIKYSSESSTDHRQRLRGKFQEKGIEALADIEVVELLLTFAPPPFRLQTGGKGCLGEIRFPARSSGCLSGAPEKKVKGMGPKNIFALQFVQGIARRYLRQRIQKKNYITSSKDVADYLIHALRFHSDKAM